MITPNTNIRLLKVPFEIARKNQLTFTNLTAQTNYFLSLPHLEYDNTTYQRQNNIIRFEAPIDDIRTYNYVMYKNESYSDKWFYAYITNMEYKNDNTTDITIQTDVFQTWQFDIVYNTMFVEREHVNNDTIGAHTIDEDLNIGDIIEEAYDEIDLSVEDELITYNYYYIVMTTYNPSEGNDGDFVGVNRVNRNIFGSKIYAFPDTLLGVGSLRSFIKHTNNKSKIDSIQAIFIAPALLIENIGTTPRTGYIGPGQIGRYDYLEIDESNEPFIMSYALSPITSFSDYQPKNNKCFVYPYNYLLISNNIGNQNIYKYEDFIYNGSINPHPILDLQLALTIGCSGRIVPRGYKNIDYNYDESLPLGKFPTCAWSSDAFTNWITQNGVNIATTVGLGILGTAIGVATGGAGLAVAGVSLAGTVGNLIGQFHQADLLPSIQGGQNTGDINFSTISNKIVIHQMRAKTEYLKQIDDYFSAFGYKINNVKIPNITGRTNWNYVKTIDCNITGEIPQEDLQELKEMFDNGVTFWHNPATFLDYSQSNAIV